MEIGHLKQHTYPRAVPASGEGALRQEYPTERQPAVGPPRVSPRQSVTSSAHLPAQELAVTHYRQAQVNAQSQSLAGLEADHAQALLAASLGEKLALARQARPTPAKRGYVPDAMVSATGKRAHAYYLQTGSAGNAGLLDEVV